MEIITKIIPYEKTNEDILLVPLGDEHAGNINFNRDKFEKYIKWIADNENMYVIGMGDYADAIIHDDDKRYDFDTLDPDMPTPDEQYDYIIDQHKPIKDKLIGLHSGNHDYELQRRHTHKYVTRDMVKTLGAPHLASNAMIRLKFKKKGKNGQSIVIASTHGSSNARSDGGKVNALKNWATSFNADLYLYAHTHARLTVERMYYELSTNNVMVERDQGFALTGGFLEGYLPGTISYVERKNLTPIKTGIVKISINPDTRKMRLQS